MVIRLHWGVSVYWEQSMEVWTILGIILFIMVLIGIRESAVRRKNHADLERTLYNIVGNPPEKKYTEENRAHIPSLYQRHKEECSIDDITWNDLEMDAIFQRLDYSHSAAGEEYLYYLLRKGNCSREELEDFETLVEYFKEQEKERVLVQMKMKELGYAGKYSLYDYLDHLEKLGKRNNRTYLLWDGLFAVLLCLFPFFTIPAIVGLVLLCIRQMVSYLGEKRKIEPYLASFSYVCRMVDICNSLCSMEVTGLLEETKQMEEQVGRLKRIKRGASLVFTITNSRTTSNPLEILLDYAHMLFHIDLILFNRMVTFFEEHKAEIEYCLKEMGKLETAISVCLFRESLKQGWCIPVHSAQDRKKIEIKEGYHPLLNAPVKNSIKADRGVLLTGSNASGKSTFLKMVAVNALLSQTIHTCAAEAYSAPVFAIYSSMSLRDNLIGGESYYVVEIKAIKRIVDRVAAGGERLLCFVDEVLRGTNTIERIAASTEILKGLDREQSLCFAATHDMELTELLEGRYQNYHFEEEIQDGDIFFAYRLLPGKASSRNAIRLLEMMGYSREVTEAAFRRANHFVQTGDWKN